jgi:hypothetical protein
MTTETDMTPFSASPRRALGALVLTALLAVAALALASAASAASPAAGWTIHSTAIPTRFSSEESAGCPGTSEQFPACDAYQVTATNAGEVTTPEGAEVTLADTLPSEVTVQKVQLFWPALAPLFENPKTHTPFSPKESIFAVLQEFGFCTTVPLRCSVPFPVAPDESIEMIAFVTVNEGAAGSQLTNSATVSGGGAPTASTSVQNPLGGPLPAFGAASVSSYVAGADGQPDTQAGDHPYELTTRIDLNSAFKIRPDAVFGVTSVEDPKNIVVDLPLGFLGSALSTPTCTFAQLSSHVLGGVGGCPTDTVIGHIFTEPVNGDSVEGPVYNMVPEHGVAAEFGFVDVLAGAHVLYARAVPTPAGYVLRTTAPEIPQVPLTDIVATFFGNPAAKNASGTTPVATFTNPSVCSGQPLSTAVHLDSWQHPGGYNADGTPDLGGPGWATAQAETFPEGLTGCNLLQFNPTLSAQPETAVAGAADSPAGLNFDLKLAQFEEPSTLATPPLRDATVTLPAGMTVNPSSAGGLQACSPTQIALQSAASPSCPDASKIGSVQLTTPLLAGTLHGSVYLASQFDNPFGSLLAGYIVIDDPDTGIVVKIPGELKADEHTGQITGVFKNNPQFPFSELKLRFKGGSRGVLATPQACGTFTTTSALTPWSAPDSGPDATPSSSFEILSGCAGGFAPWFSAGTVNPQAGGFSALTVTLSRNDGEQHLSGVTVTTPPGLSGVLSGVPLCPEPQASQGTCSSQSLIGETSVAAGVGPSPYWITGGRVYLTGPYNGGPFGLSIVVPAVAGPFNLGNVVVRSSVRIDPHTAQVTVVSDPLPQMVNSVEGLHSGIPADIRTVNVTINRPAFTFNPTSCDPMSVTGALSGARGASVPVSSRFQAAGCASLAFKPDFKVSVTGNTSKANGAGLSVKLAYPKGSLGHQANIGRVKVELPVQLPSRLTTLQKACLATTFDANPNSCPAASVVGHAKVITPLLPVPLEGPAYFVSHGGEAFPSLTIVLTGYGVTVDLVGSTFIDKKGITSTTFKSPPDVPFNTFELTLPQGKFSALAANANLCATTKLVTVKRRVTVRKHGHTTHPLRNVKQRVTQSLLMPTEFTGQNGAQLKQNTKINVTGCTKASKPKQAKHKRKRKH